MLTTYQIRLILIMKRNLEIPESRGVKGGDLFLLILFTAMCGVFFYTGIPELCAIGFFMSIVLVLGWYSFLNKFTVC